MIDRQHSSVKKTISFLTVKKEKKKKKGEKNKVCVPQDKTHMKVHCST